MVAFPPCKINLGLQIVSKRADGYHDLVTCFYPVPWCDVLEIIPAQKFIFTSTGIGIPGEEKNNLCISAYNLLSKDRGLPPVHIHLHKIIPMGAGLGGGSSDAAWTLRLLNTMFDLSLSEAQLGAYASSLGSDCAFFIRDKPAIGRSRGEMLEPTQVSLAGKKIVIVKPDVHVSTAEAFAGVKPSTPKTDLGKILEAPIETWKDHVHNDFEESVFAKFPQIKIMKSQLYEQGALYAAMSGSGSAVFGIFSRVNDNLRSSFPGSTFFQTEM